MCGICGVYGLDDKKLVKEMTDIIAHRGPDDHGYFFDEKVGLGHRRLSIIDLSGGKQPIFNEDRSICIVFNGEIYNFKEIREQLEKKGHRFSTNTDTEVIIHNYEEKGVKCVEDFNGFFAFAIWDSEKKQLFIARDRAGIKPVYYTVVEGILLFSSEIKSLLLHHQVKREVNLRSLDRYLTYRYVPGRETMFEGIYKLRPGEYITASSEDIKIDSYWRFQINEKSNKNENFYAEKLRELFEDSVKKRMISDVPIGAYLSGGIDSSSIVHFMTKHSETTVKTFCLGFEDVEKGIDETTQARQVADLYGTDHHEIVIGKNKSKLLPKIIWHLDDPLGDTAIIANYLMAESVRKHITVVLSGEGADELFGGYMQHKYLLLASKIKRIVPKFATQNVLPAVLKTVPKSVIDKFFHYPASIGQEGKRRSIKLLSNLHDETVTYTSLISTFGEDDKKDLYSSEFEREIPTKSVRQEINKSFSNNNNQNVFNKAITYEFNNWLPDDILFKLDKISMAKSLEGRVPFLDHRVIEFSAKMPWRIKIKDGNEKYILRKAMQTVLPKAVYRRKKHAFYMPITSWFGRELRDLAKNLLDSDQIKKRGYFRPSEVRKIVSGHRKEFLHEKQFMSLLILEMWHRIFIDQNREKIKKAPDFNKFF